MVINVSVQCNGGLLPDIILLTLCDSIGEPFLSLPKPFDQLEGLDAFRFFFKYTTSLLRLYRFVTHETLNTSTFKWGQFSVMSRFRHSTPYRVALIQLELILQLIQTIYLKNSLCMFYPANSLPSIPLIH